MPTAPVPAQGVHVGRVIEQLGQATGSDPAVMAGLRELADLVRQQLRCALRLRQATAAIAEHNQLAVEADEVAARLRAAGDDATRPTVDIAQPLLDGLRVATDVLGWDATLDDRALALRTGDLRHDQSVWDAWADALDVDHVLDWYEAPWHDAGPEAPVPDPHDPAIELAQERAGDTDHTLRSYLSATNSLRRQAHAKRGLVLDPTNSRLTITRVFDATNGADVVARLRDTGSCWFEIPVASLPKGADGKVRYHEVVAAGISVRLVGATIDDAHDIEVRHSGRGALRLIGDGSVVDQPLSPETVSIAMRGEATSTFGIAPTPETPAFTLAGRAVAAPWSLRLPDGGANLDGLTAIEVQIDIEAFVPDGAVTLRRVTSPTSEMAPGKTAYATVELTGPAPAGGVLVQVTSNHPEIAEPANVVVQPGQATGQFAIEVHAPSLANHVVLTAKTQDGASARIVVEIPIPPLPDIERTTVTPASSPVAQARSIAVAGTTTYAVLAPPPPPPPAPPAPAARTADPADDLLREFGDPGGASVPPGPSVPVPPPSVLVALDKAMDVTGEVTAGLGARQVVAHPSGQRLYVVTSGAHGPQGFSGAGVTMYDAGTLAPLATWTTSAGLAFADIDAAAGLVYVSHWAGRRVFVLKASDLTPVAEIGDATFTGALGVAVDPGLRRIYIARTFRSAQPHVEALTVIDRRPNGTHAIGLTIPLGTTVQPWQVKVDPVLGHVYVIGLGGGGVHPQLIVFDRATMAEKLRVNTISGVTHNRNLAVRPGTGIVHVTGDAGIQVIDVARPAVVGFVPQPHARTITASGPEQVTSMSLHNEVARIKASTKITTTDWR
jgi:hypothetical protein